MFYIDTGYTSANIPRTIRFTDAIYEQLQQICSERKISFNALVLQCCQYALSQLSTEQDKMD